MEYCLPFEFLRHSIARLELATLLILFTTNSEAFTPVEPTRATMSPSSSSSSSSSCLQASKACRFVTNKMCPFAQKAWICLEAANVPYEMEEVSLYGPGGKPDWFWDLNPKGEVPILVVGDSSSSKNDNDDKNTILADSDLILDEMSVVVSTTTNAEQQAQSSSVLVLPGPDDVVTTGKIVAFRKTLREFLPVGKSAVLGGSTTKMWNKLQELDALIDGPFVSGSDVTVADCAGFPFLWRIQQEYGTDSFQKNGCDNISVWLENCSNQDSFSKTIQSSWWWWW